jgi:hypothetical protein
MTEASFPATGLAGSQGVFDHHRRRRSLSTFLLEALHHSRRLQANRILRQHAHLITKPDQRVVSDTPSLAGR